MLTHTFQSLVSLTPFLHILFSLSSLISFFYFIFFTSPCTFLPGLLIVLRRTLRYISYLSSDILISFVSFNLSSWLLVIFSTKGRCISRWAGRGVTEDWNCRAMGCSFMFMMGSKFADWVSYNVNLDMDDDFFNIVCWPCVGVGVFLIVFGLAVADIIGFSFSF